MIWKESSEKTRVLSQGIMIEHLPANTMESDSKIAATYNNFAIFLKGEDAIISPGLIPI